MNETCTNIFLDSDVPSPAVHANHGGEHLTESSLDDVPNDNDVPKLPHVEHRVQAPQWIYLRDSLTKVH